ncbi:15003_t:CDS:2, partial [Gigaspora margarita]
KVLVVEERFLYDDSSIEKELDKSIKNELAERIIQFGSCNQKEVETDGHEVIDNYPRSARNVCKILEWSIESTENNNSNDHYKDKQDPAKYYALVQELVSEEKEPIQEPRSKINIIKSKEKNYKEVVDKINVLTEKEKFDCTFEVWMRKVKIFQETVIQNRGRVEEPTEKTFNRIYEAECKVKKKEDKEVKAETELLITYLKLAKVDYTNGKIKDLKDRFKRRQLALEKQKLTYLENEQDKLEPVNSNRMLEIIFHKIFGWYLKHAKSNNPNGQNNLNSRPTKDKFTSTKGQESLEAIDKLKIIVYNQKTNLKDNSTKYKRIDKLSELDREIIQDIEYNKEGEMVISKVEDKGRIVVSNNRMYKVSNKKIDSLSKLSQEVIQITKCSDKCQSNSKVIIVEVGNVKKNVNIDANKNDHLFDPKEAKLEFKLTHQSQLPTSYDDIGGIYAWMHKIK